MIDELRSVENIGDWGKNISNEKLHGQELHVEAAI